MPFNPSILSFSFKKNTPQSHPDADVVYTPVDFVSQPRSIELFNIPSWLSVVDQNAFQFSLRLNSTVIDTFTPGAYNANIGIRWRNRNNPVTATESLSVSLNVEAGNVLQINPSEISFNYTLGQPQAIAPRLFNISTDRNWTANPIENWIKLTSSNTGFANGAVTFNVDPNGLPVGTHKGSIVIKDDLNPQKILNVNLTITGATTSTDFIRITPENLAFIIENGGENFKTLPAIIQSSGDWTTQISHPWITIDKEADTAGNSLLLISVNTTNLASGLYAGSIVFRTGDVFETLNITLQITTNFDSGIVNDTLYFAKDRNKLKLFSAIQNSKLLLDYNASNGVENFNYQQSAPYINGIAELLVGLETEVLQKTYIPKRGTVSIIQNKITPMVFNITGVNQTINGSNSSPITGYSNLKFLKGETPKTPNKLCYIPTHVTVTKNAVLSLTLLSNSAPNTVSITGDLETSISATLENDLQTYNAIVHLSQLNLVAGNNIAITFGTITVNVTIKNDEPEVNTIAFLNEWNSYEFFETTGELVVVDAAKITTTKIATEGKTHTKVVDIDVDVEYSLNTGWIYSQNEVEWLRQILKNKRFFLYIEGEDFVEMELTTKKLEIYRTRDYLKQYTLKFKKAIV